MPPELFGRIFAPRGVPLSISRGSAGHSTGPAGRSLRSPGVPAAPARLGAQPGPRLPPRPPRAEGAGGSCRSTIVVWVSQLRSTPQAWRAAAPGKGATKNLPLPRAARGTESLRETGHREERNPETDGEVDAFHALLLIISGVTAPR